jgi:HSP20 family molecular chaperone IbpA
MVDHDRKQIASEKPAEPVTLLLDEGKSLRLIAEQSGITEEKIFIDLEKHELAISATETGSDTKVRKVIALPIKERLRKKKFIRGILDLTLEKISSV